MSVRSISRLRVRYAETDQMGVAWHGNYLAWFEVGRTDWLRERGFTYRQLEAEGLRLPVIAVQARFRRPAHYDDLLDVHTTLGELDRVRVLFRYAVQRGGELLAEGTSEHAALDEQGRVRRLPDALRHALRAAAPAQERRP